MNKRRVIWIVAGTVVAIVVLFGVVVVLAGLKFMNSLATASDPAKARAVASQIATFEVPHGYRLSGAMDMVFMRFALMSAEGAGSPSALMLEAMNVPRESRSDIMEGMRQSGNTVPCSGSAHTQDLRIVAGREAFTLKRSDCVERGVPMRTEMVNLMGKNGPVVLLATGPTDGWDERPVVALLSSFHS